MPRKCVYICTVPLCIRTYMTKSWNYNYKEHSLEWRPEGKRTSMWYGSTMYLSSYLSICIIWGNCHTRSRTQEPLRFPGRTPPQPPIFSEALHLIIDLSQASCLHIWLLFDLLQATCHMLSMWLRTPCLEPQWPLWAKKGHWACSKHVYCYNGCRKFIMGLNAFGCTQILSLGVMQRSVRV